MSGQGFRRLQEQYNDPLLTVLAVMLVVLLFVVGPLQAAGVVAAHQFGIAFGLVLVAAVFIVSGSRVALAVVLFAVALIVLSTVLRLRQPSVLDIYLDAAAWLIAGLTLSFVVARAVFAPGHVTFHRVIGQHQIRRDAGGRLFGHSLRRTTSPFFRSKARKQVGHSIVARSSQVSHLSRDPENNTRRFHPLADPGG
jgi:hypothetical protein